MPSELVQGDRTKDRTLADEIRDYIKQRDGKPGNVFLGICHRLDRPTSGVVIFAKTGKALARMNALFRENKVLKTYWAVTEEMPPARAGTLSHYLKKNEAKNKSFVVAEGSSGAKRAGLEYELLVRSERYFLVAVKPHTGRHHQIRAQLAAAGCPIKGDLKYGSRRSDSGGGIHLHAREAQFIHPVTGEQLRLTAPAPRETLWQALEQAALTGLAES